MNARLIKAAARENAASVALNHQEQPHFSALSPPRSDGKRLSPSAKAALHGDRADTLTRPDSKRPYNSDKNAKRAAAENPSPQQPPFLRPMAESAGRMRFKRLSGKNARARVGRCETEQPVFSARYRVRRAKRPTAPTKTRKEPPRIIQVRSSPFSCIAWPNPPGECASSAFQGKNARTRVGRCETEQPVFSARLPRAARPSEAACRTPAPRVPSSRRFDIRADWA